MHAERNKGSSVSKLSYHPKIFLENEGQIKVCPSFAHNVTKEYEGNLALDNANCFLKNNTNYVEEAYIIKAIPIA